MSGARRTHSWPPEPRAVRPPVPPDGGLLASTASAAAGARWELRALGIRNHTIKAMRIPNPQITKNDCRQPTARIAGAATSGARAEPSGLDERDRKSVV